MPRDWPRLQNIPIRTELSKRIREAFQQQDPKLIVPDYASLELRVLAYMEKNMVGVVAVHVQRLRVWHIPQVPGTPFYVEVPSIETAKLVLNVLAEYDTFQLNHHIKPDYCNTQGLEQYDVVEKTWYEWEDENGDNIQEVMRRDEHPDATPG